MNKPNVLVIMSDQFKATASHLWGNTFCQTPSLERMVDEGVQFQNAFTPHPLCVPARVSLWRSQFPHAHGSRRNELLMWTGGPHAFQIWKDEGFDVGLIGKNHCFDRPEDLDLFDVWCEISHGGFNRRRGFPNKGMEWVRPVEAIEEAHSVRRNMPDRGPHTPYAVSDFPLEDYGDFSRLACADIRLIGRSTSISRRGELKLKSPYCRATKPSLAIQQHPPALVCLHRSHK
ncbi:MAG: sulfatase-like hydrolase/transferase [Pirellulaceae bacterium]